MKIKLLVIGAMVLFLPGCVTSTVVRSTDLKIIRLGVESLTHKTKVQGEITMRSQAQTNGDLWKLSGRQEDALVLANSDKEQVRIFVIKSLDAMADERAAKCQFWNLSCKRRARDIR